MKDESEYKGYNLKYDGNDRLCSATYGSGNNLTSNKNVIRVEQNSIVGNNKYPIRVFYGTDNMRGAYVNRDNYSSVFFRTNSLANPLPKGGKYQTLKPKEGYVYTNR